MEAEILLETQDLVRTYGNIRAVDVLNLQVRAGEMVGLVGPDGTGKTTAMRLLCGTLTPNSGQIQIAGYKLPHQVEKACEELGYLAQRFNLHGDRAHAIIKPEVWTPEKLSRALTEKGLKVDAVETVQSTLEDVFTLLAHG